MSKEQGQLARILDTPHLELVVPQLPAEVLHRVIQTWGLEECSELVALATPRQLAGVLDLDLWRSDRPGLDERFDASRFGEWLEALVESGADVAAIVAKVDARLVTAAIAAHTRVFDRAAAAPFMTLDGEMIGGQSDLDAGLSCDVGGYMVVATRTDSWEAIVATLVALNVTHQHYFHRVMRGCRQLSNSRPEIDGLDDRLGNPEQVEFDLASTREGRREKQGYVTPAEARAFLQVSRKLPRGPGTTPPDSPISRAYFRAMDADDEDDARDGPPAAPDSAPASEESRADDIVARAATAATGAFMDILQEAGVLPQQPRALLEAPRADAAPRLARIRRHMQFVHDTNAVAYLTRSQELAYLANTITAGCSIQARPIEPAEASDAAVAVCNLGLENWPPHWLAPLPDDFLVGHDLICAFQVGWAVLYEQVCMYTAEQLIRTLRHLRCNDGETQAGLNALRKELTGHWKAGAPWHASDALDVIAILDTPAWAALLGLIAEFPVLHGGITASRDSRVRAVSASAFEFISENDQIAAVREFIQLLPKTLA